MTEEGQSVTDATHSTLLYQPGDENDEEAVSYETPSSAPQLDISSHEGLSVQQTGGHEVDLSGLSISPSHSSTPRPPTAYYQRSSRPSPSTPLTSAYGDMTPQLQGTQRRSVVTPGKSGRNQHPSRPADNAEREVSSPFVELTPFSKFSHKGLSNNRSKNPVLHHVLDKTYRIQATPLSKATGYTRPRFPTTPKNQTGSRFTLGDSPLSSPELEAPKLHEEIFASPSRDRLRTPAGRKAHPMSGNNRHTRVTPRPGVSVLTPGRTLSNRQLGERRSNSDDEYDDDGDDDRLDVSPPKTMQFHIPQNRLMKTPGKFNIFVFQTPLSIYISSSYLTLLWTD
jgi:DASH complex subunit ASK1